MPALGNTLTDKKCDAAFEADDYPAITAYCTTASEEYGVAAAGETGHERANLRYTQGIDLLCWLRPHAL